MSQHKRQGNIEFLRIIIMFMILVLHANHATFGVPDKPLSLIGITRNFLEALTIVPVNIFVLITGFFGIDFKSQKIFSLLFQCFFAVVPISLILWACDLWKPESIIELVRGFNFINYWFIIAYIGLLFFVPILNVAIKSFSKHQLMTLVIILYLFFGIGDYIHLQSTAITTNGGYSALWFLIIYLIGAYIRLYGLPKIGRVMWLCLYFGSVIGLTFISMPISILGISYDNPFTLLASISLFMFFHSLSINSKMVLWTASGTTMVYLLNTHPILFSKFKETIIFFYSQNNLLSFLAYALGYLILFFFISIFYDKLREIVWRRIKILITNATNNLDKWCGF